MRRSLLALLCASLILSPTAVAQQRDWEDAGDLTPRTTKASGLDIEWSYDGVASAVYSAPSGSGVGVFESDRRYERFTEPRQLGDVKPRAVFDVARDTGFGAPFVAWWEPASIGGGGTILTVRRPIENQTADPVPLATTDGEVLEVRAAAHAPDQQAVWRERTADGNEIIRFAESDSAEPVTPLTLESGKSFKDLHLMTGGENRVLVTWTDADGRAWISRRGPDETRFRAPLALTPRGSHVVGSKQLGPFGDPFTIVYVEKRNSGGAARTVAIRGDLSEANVSRAVFPAVSAKGAGATDVQLAEGGSRLGTVVAWRDRAAGGKTYLRTAIARKGKKWSVKTAARANGTDLAVHIAGSDVELYWLNSGVIRTASRSEKGRWGDVTNVSGKGVSGFDVGTAEDGNGAELVWTRRAPNTTWQIEIAVVDGGSRGSVTSIGRYPNREVPSDPTIVSTGEIARAIWWRVDSTTARWWHAAANDSTIVG